MSFSEGPHLPNSRGSDGKLDFDELDSQISKDLWTCRESRVLVRNTSSIRIWMRKEACVAVLLPVSPRGESDSESGRQRVLLVLATSTVTAEH